MRTRCFILPSNRHSETCPNQNTFLWIKEGSCDFHPFRDPVGTKCSRANLAIWWLGTHRPSPVKSPIAKGIKWLTDDLKNRLLAFR